MDVQEIRQLDAYLKKLFGTPQIRVVPKAGDFAEIFVGEDDVGELTVDDEDGERSYNFRMVIQIGQDPIDPAGADAQRLSAAQIRQREYPRGRRGRRRWIRWKSIWARNSSACCFVENEKGRKSYILELPILDVDLVD